MTSKHIGVMAAPNRCEVKLRVVSVTRSDRFPDKRELAFELLEVRPESEPDFASKKLGQRVDGFTFDNAVELSAGDLILAVAEYLGGPRQGLFQLSELRPA